MGWVFLWLVLAFGTQIWLCFRVGRSNIPLAIGTFFIGFPAAGYTFFKRRGDAGTSVTVPFIANVVFTILFFVSAWQTVLPRLEAQGLGDDPAAVLTPAVRAAPPVPVPASAPVVAAVAASAVEPAASAPPLDPVDAFSVALRAAGLNPSVTRVADISQFPAGTQDAALVSLLPKASAASAARAAEVTLTLLRCASPDACRNLAGTYMQQGGPDKKRVIQNGLLMLLVPLTPANADDLTPAAAASVFRKLPGG